MNNTMAISTLFSWLVGHPFLKQVSTPRWFVKEEILECPVLVVRQLDKNNLRKIYTQLNYLIHVSALSWVLIISLKQVGKVSTNFAAAKNGKVNSNFSAAKIGQVSSNSKKRLSWQQFFCSKKRSS